MGFLILAETIAVGVIFGVPGLVSDSNEQDTSMYPSVALIPRVYQFQNVIFDIMNKTLKDYNKKGQSGIIAVALWNVITIVSGSILLKSILVLRQ